MDKMIEAVPLCSVKEGTYRIVALTGGRGFIRRLTHMGLYPNARIEVISSGGYGPMRVNVKGSQFGLGRGMASKIIVEKVIDAQHPPEKIYTLRDYREGQRGRILDVKGEGKFKKRIMEMGFVKGAEIYVEKYAPLRDPIEFIIKGYHVGLRRDEAEKIIMTEPW